MSKSNLKEYVANSYVAKVKIQTRISVCWPKSPKTVPRTSGWYAVKIDSTMPLRMSVLLRLQMQNARTPKQIECKSMKWLPGVPDNLRSA